MSFEEGKGLVYRVICKPAGVKRSFPTFEALEKAIDEVKKGDPEAVLDVGFAGWFGEKVKGPAVPKMQDLVDFLTLLPSKGADLRRLVTRVYPRG